MDVSWRLERLTFPIILPWVGVVSILCSLAKIVEKIVKERSEISHDSPKI